MSPLRFPVSGPTRRTTGLPGVKCSGRKKACGHGTSKGSRAMAWRRGDESDGGAWSWLGWVETPSGTGHSPVRTWFPQSSLPLNPGGFDVFQNGAIKVCCSRNMGRDVVGQDNQWSRRFARAASDGRHPPSPSSKKPVTWGPSVVGTWEKSWSGILWPFSGA